MDLWLTELVGYRREESGVKSLRNFGVDGYYEFFGCFGWIHGFCRWKYISSDFFYKFTINLKILVYKIPNERERAERWLMSDGVESELPWMEKSCIEGAS
jgi:hypothetical protein